MKAKVIIYVSLRIIMIFSVGITMSFIGDYLKDFLGDWKCQGSISIMKDSYRFTGCNYGESFHNPEYHWGWRHWLFMLMGLCLFILQAIDIISYLTKKQQ